MTSNERAEALADYFLTNGAEQRGVRLVITGAEGENLGGWGRTPIVLAVSQVLAANADSAREEGRREERANRESVWLANVAQIEAQAYARGVEAMQDAIVQELAWWHDQFVPSIMKDVAKEACSRAALVALVPEAGREGK